MNYTKRNSQRLDKAFSKLLKQEREYAEKTFKESTKRGYERAVELHEVAQHELHLLLGGDFGSAVITDGKIVYSDVMTGPAHFSGKVEAHMQKEAGKGKGITGIVMSEMAEGFHNDSFERGVLNSGAQKAFGWALYKMHNMRIKK